MIRPPDLYRQVGDDRSALLWTLVNVQRRQWVPLRGAQRCGSTTTVPILPPRSTSLCAAAVSYSGEAGSHRQDTARRCGPAGYIGLCPTPVHMWNAGE